MTDRFKGYLVTLSEEVRQDDADNITNALACIKGVHSVSPYVKGMEDYMLEGKGRQDMIMEMMKFCKEQIMGKK